MEYCEDTNTVLNAVGTGSYEWSNGVIISSISVTEGTYTVTLTDANGCTATSSVEVTEEICAIQWTGGSSPANTDLERS